MSHQLSLDDVCALCEEISSLTRAGVPLDQGLTKLAEDLPTRLAKKSTELSERLAAGEELADLVIEEGTELPPVYRSVIQAGLRSGQLTSALEGFTRMAKQFATTRRMVTTSLFYPFVLLVLLSIAGLLLMSTFSDVLSETAEFQRYQPTGYAVYLPTLLAWGRWFWILPAMMAALLGSWFLLTGRGAVAEPQAFAGLMSWIPGVGSLLRHGRLTLFTEVLSLLVEHDTPLHDAVALAGDACGDRRIQAECHDLACSIHQGMTAPKIPKHRRGIPALLQWSLLREKNPKRMRATLQRAQETYARRLHRSAEWLQVYLPLLFTVLIGGVMTMLYAVCILGSFYGMMHSISTQF